MSRRYGLYGGAYLPEVLVEPVRKFEEMWNRLREDSKFLEEFDHILKTYAGRPTPLDSVVKKFK